MAQSLKLVGDTWAPFTDKAGSSPGFMVELAGAVLEKAGYKWTYNQQPWARAIQEVKSGTSDILVAIPEDQGIAEGLLLCSTPYGFNTNDFFVNSDSKWMFKGIASLKTECLGAILDYSYNAEIDAYLAENAKNNSLVQLSTGVNPMEISLKKLTGGRISVIIDDKSVILWQAKKLGLDGKIKSAGSLGSPIPSFLAISPKNPKAKEIASKLAAGLSALKGTSDYKKILAKYGVTPW